MKLKNQLTLTAVLGISLFLGACSSGLKVDDASLAAKNVEQPVAAVAAVVPVAAPMSKVVQVVVPAHLDPQSSLSKNRSVFFEFDDFSIKKEYVPVVENHSKYLTTNPKLTVRLEGNADERGGREYNLALGQKRAEAVARSMKLFGSKDAQIEAVSFGSEKPKAIGHDEASWAQNRRVDITYQGK
jgi:peptidoglycan-associated lipoprotein